MKGSNTLSIIALTILFLLLAGLASMTFTAAADAAGGTAGLKLRIEPRIAPVDGVIRIYVISVPPGYSAVVARLEGPVTTGYVTLTPGSVAAIDLSLYSVKPGLYYVAVYDAPGGHLLARIPVLVVKPLILISPPKPTVGKPFTITVAIQPAGYEYRVVLHIDGKVYEMKPGQRITVELQKRGPYRLCLDVEAVLEGEKFYTPNLTCTSLVLNLPPSVSMDLRVQGGYLILSADSMDPDGIVTSVKYTCTIDNKTFTGYISPGFASIVLTTLDTLKRYYQEGYRTLKCSVEAVDDAGASRTVTKSLDIASLLGLGKKSVSGARKNTAERGAATSTRGGRVKQTGLPSSQTMPPPTPMGGARLPLPRNVLLLAVIGGVAAAAGGASLVMLRRRRRAAPAKHRPVEAESGGGADLTSIIVRLDRVEQRLDELYARVGELQGEVDELRRRVRRLERSGEKQGR